MTVNVIEASSQKQEIKEEKIEVENKGDKLEATKESDENKLMYPRVEDESNFESVYSKRVLPGGNSIVRPAQEKAADKQPQTCSPCSIM